MSVATQTAEDPRRRAANASARDRRERRRFAVHGVVQGVGFRPFVWNLATRLELSGWVRNTSGAVIIEVEGEPARLETFAAGAPPRRRRVSPASRRRRHAAIDTTGGAGSDIVESRAVDGEYQPIAPDAATCPECVSDILAIRAIAATATPSPTARTAVRGSRSSRTSRTTGR